ncbi:MAG: response regulator [Thalassotalea sp.]
MKILLVDDKSIVLNTISSFLEDLGHEVDQASNGLAGFEITHQNDYDLFIIDHLMPVMDGLQLIKRLRKQDKTNTTPIFLMSTQDIKELQYLLDANQISHLLSKPINYSNLEDIISSYQTENTLNLSL